MHITHRTVLVYTRQIILKRVVWGKLHYIPITEFFLILYHNLQVIMWNICGEVSSLYHLYYKCYKQLYHHPFSFLFLFSNCTRSCFVKSFVHHKKKSLILDTLSIYVKKKRKKKSIISICLKAYAFTFF